MVKVNCHRPAAGHVHIPVVVSKLAGLPYTILPHGIGVKSFSVPVKAGAVNQKLGALIEAMAESMAKTVPAVGSMLPSESNSRMVPGPVPVEAARPGMLNWLPP